MRALPIVCRRTRRLFRFATHIQRACLLCAGRPAACVFTKQRQADVFRVRITGRLQAKKGNSVKWIGEGVSDDEPDSDNDTDPDNAD